MCLYEKKDPRITGNAREAIPNYLGFLGGVEAEMAKINFIIGLGVKRKGAEPFARRFPVITSF